MHKRSEIHMLMVAAARLESCCANPKLIADLRATADVMAKRKAEGRAHVVADDRRIEGQRTLFAMLPDSRSVDQLKAAMMQRAYDLLWDGDCSGCDALLEFVPSLEAGLLLDAWCSDQEDKAPKSRWYENGR